VDYNSTLPDLLRKYLNSTEC